MCKHTSAYSLAAQHAISCNRVMTRVLTASACAQGPSRWLRCHTPTRKHDSWQLSRVQTLLTLDPRTFQPASLRRHGRTTSAKVTRLLTGLPGKPNTSRRLLPPGPAPWSIVANVSGLPGFMSTYAGRHDGWCVSHMSSL